MTQRDLAANLEFWSGRARRDPEGEEPERPRKPYRRARRPRLPLGRPRRLTSFRLSAFSAPSWITKGPGDEQRPGRSRSRTRPVAAALLLAGLTGAWLLVGHQSHGSAAPAPPGPAAITATTPAAAHPTTPPADAINHAVVNTDGCSNLSVAQPHVRCVARDALVVEEIALYTPATVAAAFRKIAGGVVTAHSGPAACANGQSDERAWSVASAPQNAVGRYLCRIEAGRAEMWWTHGARLLHAVINSTGSNDRDLAHLFTWWSAHPSA